MKKALILFVIVEFLYQDFQKTLFKRGFTGTVGLVGIPGSIGGGVCMNASSYGNEYVLI